MRIRRFATTLIGGCTLCALPALSRADDTWRVSTDSLGAEGTGPSSSAALSGDGRFVAFSSDAADLVPGDGNGVGDAFVHDRLTGTTTRISVDSAGIEANGASVAHSISLDGRYIAFSSEATNLVPGDTNASWDCFVHDRILGTTSRISVDSSGAEGNADSTRPVLAGDGNLVAISSDASNLVPGDTNGQADVFVHDRSTGLTIRASVHSDGTEGDRFSSIGSMSADGRFVTFFSVATNLVSGDSNGKADVFVHELATSNTTRVSVDSSGTQGDLGSFAPTISGNGRFVAFHSFAQNLVPGDGNGAGDVFVHDRQTATTTRVSIDSTGREADDKSLSPSISGDGRYVAFSSLATNLVADTNRVEDCFVHDRETSRTTRVSVDGSLAEGDAASHSVAISADGRFVSFSSQATNLVPGDTNGQQDVFVRGPALTLEANPGTVSPGDAITFTTWTGLPSAPALLVLTDLNGSPLFQRVLLARFDAAGLWSLPGTVPPGLSGNRMTFKTLGFAPSGKVEISNGEEVRFED